eukprot:COSAG01_NODE_4427_length_5035_cov_2.138574_6_plen_131_part_00
MIPGQKGVQIWDLSGIGRIAILICFDINYYELWHQAYALGAQVVFWPSMMSTPDRDAISLSRLFRFHIVANGRWECLRDLTSIVLSFSFFWRPTNCSSTYCSSSPGNIHDTTGTSVPDLHTLAGGVVTGM